MSRAISQRVTRATAAAIGLVVAAMLPACSHGPTLVLQRHAPYRDTITQSTGVIEARLYGPPKDIYFECFDRRESPRKVARRVHRLLTAEGTVSSRTASCYIVCFDPLVVILTEPAAPILRDDPDWSFQPRIEWVCEEERNYAKLPWHTPTDEACDRIVIHNFIFSKAIPSSDALWWWTEGVADARASSGPVRLVVPGDEPTALIDGLELRRVDESWLEVDMVDSDLPPAQ